VGHGQTGGKDKVKRTFRFLQATSSYGVKYSRGYADLKVSNDAAFAGDEESTCSLRALMLSMVTVQCLDDRSLDHCNK
jgi:hypothetical protein